MSEKHPSQNRKRARAKKEHDHSANAGNGRTEPPLPLAAAIAVVGLIAAIIAIAGAPAWVIGVAIGALLAIAIPPLRHRALKWPTDWRACLVVVLVIAVGGGAGAAVDNSTSGGGATTIRSNKADLSATGYKNGKWFEQEAEGGAEAFGEPGVEATKSGHPISPLAIVQVSCRVYDTNVPSAHPDGYWYRVASKPWNNKSYVAANSFWNGSNIVRGPGVKNTDDRVPICK